MQLVNNTVCPVKFFPRQKSWNPFLTWTVLYVLCTYWNTAAEC